MNKEYIVVVALFALIIGSAVVFAEETATMQATVMCEPGTEGCHPVSPATTSTAPALTCEPGTEGCH